MLYFKTFGVTFSAAALLFLVWVSVLVHQIKTTTNSKTFGLGLLITPIVSVWFWIAVIAVGAIYFRLSR
jgi:hypothetical protein